MRDRSGRGASALLLVIAWVGWCLGSPALAAPFEIVLQQAQKLEVLGLVYSPDGRVLISSGESEAIRVWDAETGELVRLLPGHPERVRGLAMSADGRQIASSSTDGLVKVWDYHRGRLLHTFTNHVGGWVRDVAFSPDGRYLVPAAYDGKMSIWDLAGGETVRTLPMPGRIADVLFTPDGRTIVTASREQDSLIRFLDVETGQVRLSLHHSNILADVAISRDGRWLASAKGGGEVRLWELPAGRLVRVFTAPDGQRDAVEAVAFSPNGRILAAAIDKVIGAWDRETGRLLQTFAALDTVHTLAFHPDGEEIAAGGANAEIRQWRIRDGKLKRVFGRRPPGMSVTSLAFSGDGQYEAQGTASGQLRVWRAHEGTFVHDLRGHEGAIQSLGFTSDHVWLCSGGMDRRTRVWRLDSGVLSLIYPVFDIGEGMGAIAIGGGENWVATASGPWGSAEAGSGIKLWPVLYDRPIRVLEGHRGAVRSIAYTPASDLLASFSDDGTVKLWDSASGDCLQTQTNDVPMKVLAFSPGSEWLAAGLADGRVRVLHTNRLNVSREWPAHRRFVQSLAFSADGRWLATAGGDQSVAVWDWPSGREICRFTNVTSQYLPLAFHPGQPVLAFASQDDTVVHANVETGVELFRRVLFPDGEWLAYNTATACYQSSPHGDEHARLRFDGRLHPVYPLAFYRQSLQRTNSLFAAGATTPAGVAPKRLQLWWHRYPYKTAWSYGGLTVFGALVGTLLWRGWIAERRRRAQAAFSRQLLRSQELERKRIAAELHDSLGQELLIIKNRLYLAQQNPGGPPPAAQLEEISQAVSHAIQEVRQISHNLRPYQLDRLGLTKAVQAVIKQVAGSASLRLESELDKIDGLFSAEGEIHFYRIVQECLNNILKHSDAATARVAIRRAGGRIIIGIEDDGRGFDYKTTMSDAEHPHGFGLNGLHERVRILQGQFHCDSSPGHGTRLKFEIPIPANEKASHHPDGG